MNFLKIVTKVSVPTTLFFAMLSLSHADSPLSGEGSITKISGTSVEIGGIKYQHRTSTKVLDENGATQKGQTVSKLGKGAYLEFKARDNDPFPVLVWVRILGD